MPALLDPYRGLKFVTHWTLAHALGVGTLLLVIVLLAKAWVLQIGNGSLYLAIFLAFGAIAGLQQLLLKSNGMPAPLWWLTSYFGLATGAVLATGAGNVFGIVGAVLVFGVCCGAIQMLACGQLLQRAWVWPLANILSWSLAALVASSWRFSNDMFSFYLYAVTAGAAYGVATGVGLLFVMPKLPDET